MPLAYRSAARSHSRDWVLWLVPPQTTAVRPHTPRSAERSRAGQEALGEEGEGGFSERGSGEWLLLQPLNSASNPSSFVRKR